MNDQSTLAADHQSGGRRNEILDAALRVFSEQGFHKATIKRIAERAKLRSPALIYWYFENKWDLFQCAILDRAPILKLVSAREEMFDLPPRQALRQIAGTYLESLDGPVAKRLFRVFISEAVRNRQMAQHFAKRGPLMVAEVVAAYLRHQIELGRLRPHDAESSARAFMGMVVVYVLARELFPPLAAGFPERDRYVEDLVGIFLDGLGQED
ncbi:MAG: TetR/AcrR family transcriptional regulator [Acidimicrobiia bacterium]